MKTLLLSLVIACCLGSQAFAQYQWNRLDIFGTYAYEVTVHTDGSILAATASGLYRSADNGEHWIRARKSFPDFISVIPGFTNIGETFDIAGNHYVMARADIDGWHYYSSDHGVTWQEANDSSDYFNKGLTVRLTTQNKSLLAGIYDSGIWRSTDGKTYHQVLSTPSNTPVVLMQTPSGTLFAGGKSGRVFSSSNDGQTWKEYTVPGTESIVNTHKQLLLRDNELLYLTGKSIYRSMDGIQWTETPISYPIIIGTAVLSPDGDIIAVVRDDTGMEHIARLPKSGTEPVISNQGLIYFPISNIAVGPNGWFIAAKGGVLRSTDQGVTWQTTNTGFDNSLYSVLSLKDGSTLINSAFYDLYKYQGSGTAASSLRSGLPQSDIGDFYDMTMTHEGTIIVTAGDHGFYRSTDQGATFKNIPYDSFVGGICTRSNGDLVATRDSTGLLISKDDGKTWTEVLNFQVLGASIMGHVAENSKGELFMSSLSLNDIFHISPDLQGIIPLSTLGAELVLVHDDIFLIGGFSFVMVSTDNGVSWQNVTPPAITENYSMRSLAVGPNGEIFCASNSGLYRSDDRGATWKTAGWQDNIVTRVSVDKKGLLYVNVRDSGNYVAQIPTGVAENTPVSLPTSSAFPNPASDFTQLHCTTRCAGHMQIILYNALGQKVMVVADGFREAGEQIISLPTNLLAPGMYHYTVQSDSETTTGDLTVVR